MVMTLGQSESQRQPSADMVGAGTYPDTFKVQLGKPETEPWHVDAEVQMDTEGTALKKLVSRNPIRMLAPKRSNHGSWLYGSSYGGGLVGGDRVNMRVHVGSGATCVMGTQASSKVFKSGLMPSELEAIENQITTENQSATWQTVYDHGAIQRLHATLASDSVLVLAPDPVSPFRDSIYFQDQVFEMASSANLIMIDWVTSGRLAYGECWDLERFYSRNAILKQDELIYLDALQLGGLGPFSQKDKLIMNDCHCYATFVVLGTKFKDLTECILAEARHSVIHSQARSATRRNDSLIYFSASPFHGGVVVRLLGQQVETTRQHISRWLENIESQLGAHPWSRKW